MNVKRERRFRVFENRVLRRIFGPKKYERTGGWGILYNKELHNLYSRNIIRMIKSRRVRWAGHVARMGGETLKAGYHYEDVDVEGRIILMWILEK
jgi:hypothetical protein